MNPQHRFSPSAAAAHSRQRGVYALEWAIIFPVFFMLLYAIISFGLVFLVRESMQLVAEDGARAALQYQPSRAERLDKAKSIVTDKLQWLPPPSSITATVCSVGSPEICSPSLECGSTIDKRCMVLLSVTIPYGSSPLVPDLKLFGMSIFAPDQLTATASIVVDQAGI